ncbi:DUF2243 domain-containing protein [Pseudonocardia kujensis]|uniref:DUF2243 domain-containing protein n=1 Tax=Pseudonocardia kujensis TaxID=1128675 RepID=UPI001E44881A|nr:DUF2243 domain-containing protein [Pseudonocardia kujensis]MCE0763822.1 DUF2243 domain-containing protein [Pseudonocardia kujensis]
MVGTTGTDRAVTGRAARRNALAGVLLGLGVVAFADETVFHQLLHWHHFYDRAGSAAGLVSDGLFHAFGWAATVAALFLIAALRRDRAARPLRVVGGALAGGGAFQLYDGLVQHKLLGLHQIRYVPDVLVYDVVWNVLAAVLLVAGLVLLVRTRERGA